MATFGTFVAGQVLTAAELNAAGTWQDYTPTWTQSATITKTVNWARYMQFGKLVTVSVKMTATSAGTANNLILIGLPVTASSNNDLMGTVVRRASGTLTNALRFSFFNSSSTVKFSISTANASSADFHGLTAADSITIASGDVYVMQLTYEAA